MLKSIDLQPKKEILIEVLFTLILIPATSSLLPPLLFEPALSVEKIGRAPHPPLLIIAFTSLICTTVYITATIAIVAIFTAGIALCPQNVINDGCP